jgi:hypothetical protein
MSDATVDVYLAALLAHDPAKAPLAKTVRFTENTATLQPGEGLWVGASEEPTTFKVYVPDPVTATGRFLGVMREFDHPVLLALRLRLVNTQITEIEHIVSRSLTDEGLRNLVTPRPGLVTDVPPLQRVPRAQMLTLANGYYESILRTSSAATSYAPDCERHENGISTSGSRERAHGVTPIAPGSPTAIIGRIRTMTCAAAIDTGYLGYITGIDLRRITIADEERGLVFATAMFRHRGDVRSLTILNVPGVDTVPMDFGPLDLLAVHVFKIAGGKIHEIEAMGLTLPYKSMPGMGAAGACDCGPFSEAAGAVGTSRSDSPRASCAARRPRTAPCAAVRPIRASLRRRPRRPAGRPARTASAALHW